MQDNPINKTTMKRIFLLFSLLLGVLSAWAYDVELDGIFYNLDKENKTASVASYSYKGAVVIPETISVDGKAYTVTSLGEKCFSGCSGLTSITIPNSVTSLGKYCFYECSGLTEVHANRETPPRSSTAPHTVSGIRMTHTSRCYSMAGVSLPVGRRHRLA